METLTVETRDRVAYVTFVRPRSLNSITEAMIGELDEVCDLVDGSPEVRALVITGSDDVFCVGLDLDLLRRAFADPPFFRSVLERYGGVLRRLGELEVPVVAAVNGLARAGGFELILACDLVVVAEEARIGDYHTPFGVIPGGGSTQRLSRRVGEQRALELISTGRWLRSGEAVAWGVALRAVPRAALADAVEALVGDLRTKPRATLAAVKRLVGRGADLSLEEALDLEIEVFIDRLRAPESEAVEGFTAFVEGRAPGWL